MSAEGPKAYPVVYDPQAGLQYGFQTGYVSVPGTGSSGGKLLAYYHDSVNANLLTLTDSEQDIFTMNVTPKSATSNFLVQAIIKVSLPTTGDQAALRFTANGTQFSIDIEPLNGASGEIDMVIPMLSYSQPATASSVAFVLQGEALVGSDILVGNVEMFITELSA